MSKRGVFIVIEGLDGSGKATQVALLHQYLQKHGHDVVLYDFPRYYDNFWGKMVGRMLTGEFGSDINPYLRSPFYFLDQADASKQIVKDLAAGKIVLSNRYLSSSVIFQSAQFTDQKEKQEYLDWLFNAAYVELGMQKPDKVLCLYVDPEAARQMNLKKNQRNYLNGSKEDLNEKNYELQRKVAVEVKRFCKELTGWELVDCMENDRVKSPEAISLNIVKIIEPLLK